MKSLFIGRYQPFHNGHKALIETVLREGNGVVIAVRDTTVDKDNPYLAIDRKQMIEDSMKAWKDKVEVIIIPDITEVCYGRKVGWGVREISLPQDIEAISATQIREKTVGKRQKERQKLYDVTCIQTPPKRDPDFETFVFYHGNCIDGFGAAVVAHKVLGDQNVTYIPCTYGDEKVDPLKKAFGLAKKKVDPKKVSVVLVDFTYPKETLLSMKSRCAELTVLDHHHSAQKDLEGLDFCIFDMEKSGAMLAWEYWFPHQASPQLIKYIQDRDLWQFKLPGSEEVTAALRSQPRTFEVWQTLLDDGHQAIEDLKKEGSVILTHQNQMVDIMCQEVSWQEIGDCIVPVVNASVYFSEVANRLCNLYPTTPFAAYFYDRPNTRQYGLRSLKGKADVSQIAKLYGGGGHIHAAGFNLPQKSDKIKVKKPNGSVVKRET